MERKNDWYRSFFGKAALDLWEKAIPEERTRREIELFEELVQPTAEATLLDTPCGPGRHTMELARRGYHVTGVDISFEALNRAAMKAKRLGLNVNFLQGDLANISLGRELFHGVLCLGNSFGYFDRRKTADFLRRVGEATQQGGGLLLDSRSVAESLLPNLDEKNWVEVGDILMLVENNYLVEEGCLETDYTFIHEGVRETARSFHFVFSVSEVAEMLRRAGFSVEGIYGGLDCRSFELGDPEVFLFARK